MDRQTAVEEAARAVLEHGGPNARTDPHAVVAAMGQAIDLGATHEDISAEMARQRGK
ncbi:hypothetical protein ABTZ57_01355 [Streptomyces sp. NPDC094048]|uniref:hypothetical protein n=1 Tax=unclassified Streptomyces TaxID=2593676 RepID=UPI00331E53E3